MDKMNNLYEDTPEYEVIRLKDRSEWLDRRQKRIGGSDASALIGMNPWKTKAELWDDKVAGIRKEISSPAIEYGTKAEEHIRELFALKHPDLDVQYEPDVILDSKLYDWMAYSPDGLLVDGGLKGIWECKTHLVHGKVDYAEWNDRIPDAYYIQVLHGLLVTGFDFVILTAELRWQDGQARINEYRIERREVTGDLEWLEETERSEIERFYKAKKRPPIEIKL